MKLSSISMIMLFQIVLSSKEWKITESSVLFCSSPLTFDPAVLFLLISLRTGAKLVGVGSSQISVIDGFRKLMHSGVTHIQVCLTLYLTLVGVITSFAAIFSVTTTVAAIVSAIIILSLFSVLLLILSLL